MPHAAAYVPRYISQYTCEAKNVHDALWENLEDDILSAAASSRLKFGTIICMFLL